MTKTEVTRIVYIANDGKEFANEYGCVEHEKRVERNKKRSEYLSQQLTALLRELNPDKDRYDFVVEISDSLNTVIKQKLLGGFPFNDYHEPDENFNLKYSVYELFKELSQIRYGFDASVPSYYWGK